MDIPQNRKLTRKIVCNHSEQRYLFSDSGPKLWQLKSAATAVCAGSIQEQEFEIGVKYDKTNSVQYWAASVAATVRRGVQGAYRRRGVMAAAAYRDSATNYYQLALALSVSVCIHWRKYTQDTSLLCTSTTYTTASMQWKKSLYISPAERYYL